MDRLIKRYDVKRGGDDLVLCKGRGIAYQRDRTHRIQYGADYLATFDSTAYSRSPVALAVNAGRVALLARHMPAGSAVLDIGCGSGAFVRAARSAGFEVRGFDVIAEAAKRMREAGTYAEEPGEFDAITLWDSIEHMDDPELCIGRMKRGAKLFVSLPIFDDLGKVRESKHYKPAEHLYYWTDSGFVDWIALHGFRLLERSSHETDAGRKAIGAFVFCRDLPDYRDHIEAY